MEDECWHAIVFESVMNVESAENTAAIEGGSLKLAGTNIPLYHYSETFHGDVSDDLDGAVRNVCERTDN